MVTDFMIDYIIMASGVFTSPKTTISSNGAKYNGIQVEELPYILKDHSFFIQEQKINSWK